MSDRCLKPEELADLSAGLSADDPRRAHLEACPRCQAVLKSFAGFMDPVDAPAGADVADAHARLAAALDREIEASDRVVRPAPSFWTPFRVRTLAATAAVLIVAVGISIIGQQVGTEAPLGPSGEPVLRGLGAPSSPFRCQVEMLPGGDWRVAWPGVAEATAYRVVVYDTDLKELASIEAGPVTFLEFAVPEGASFCRVIALRGGDEMGRSEPAYFDNC